MSFKQSETISNNEIFLENVDKPTIYSLFIYVGYTVVTRQYDFLKYDVLSLSFYEIVLLTIALNKWCWVATFRWNVQQVPGGGGTPSHPVCTSELCS